MKRRFTVIVFLIILVVFGLTSCRTRELCPAYTDNRQEI